MSPQSSISHRASCSSSSSNSSKRPITPKAAMAQEALSVTSQIFDHHHHHSEPSHSANPLPGTLPPTYPSPYISDPDFVRSSSTLVASRDPHPESQRTYTAATEARHSSPSPTDPEGSYRETGGLPRRRWDLGASRQTSRFRSVSLWMWWLGLFTAAAVVLGVGVWRALSGAWPR